jgi:transcriptional regulator with XRE-family HTH domain
VTEATTTPLRTLRERHLWTQEDLATRANVSERTITRIEHGELSCSIRTIRALCDALGVEPAAVREFAIRLEYADEAAEGEE